MNTILNLRSTGAGDDAVIDNQAQDNKGDFGVSGTITNDGTVKMPPPLMRALLEPASTTSWESLLHTESNGLYSRRGSAVVGRHRRRTREMNAKTLLKSQDAF